MNIKSKVCKLDFHYELYKEMQSKSKIELMTINENNFNIIH